MRGAARNFIGRTASPGEGPSLPRSVVAYLPPGLRSVLVRTGSVATGVPTAMGGASNRDSSVLPEHAVGPVESFINEFGRLNRGSPLRQLVGSVVAIARCHRLPESEPRVGCTPSAIHRQRREQGSGGGRRSDAIDSTEIIRPAGGSDRDKSEEPRGRWTLESAVTPREPRTDPHARRPSPPP